MEGLNELICDYAIYLAVNDLKLFEMVREISLLQNWLYRFKWVLIKYVSLVGYRLKIFQVVQTFKNGCKLFVINTTIVKKNPINGSMVQKLTNFSQSTTLAYI